MPRIIYVEQDGRSHTTEVASGRSVMEGAREHNIPGIEAECGGACACGTCHVYVDEAWAAAVGPPGDMEASMLEFANDVLPCSHLSCQIKVTDALDGLVVRIPFSQH